MEKNTSNFQRYLKQFIKLLFGLVECFVHWLFSKIYRKDESKLPPIEDFILMDSASTLAMKIRTGKLTSEKVLESFIDRIKQVNPIINSVVATRFDEARKEAKSADEIIRTGLIPLEKLEKEKPFLGVPFTTKDCIPIKDLIHSSGLVHRRNNISEEDAKVVASLRNAGAIPLGLTNVSELCMWWESSNNVHGRSRNPYDFSRIVGGSSGGEGSCQAAALSAFGIGSDIGGSIRMPSFFNGVFGHKPSPLTVPNHGQYPQPITEEQNIFLGIGPMCRRAEDLTPILKVIANKSHLEMMRLDEPVDIQKVRFFYQESDTDSFLVSPVAQEIKDLFPKICIYLNKAHGIKASKVSFKSFGKSAPLWFANMKAPSGPKFKDQLANLDGTINPYVELLKWTLGMSQHTFVALATCLADKTGCKYGDSDHQKLVSMRNDLKNDILDLIGDDGVFIYPTHPTSAPYHNEPIFKPFNFSYTGIMNILGVPATHIPMGLDKNGLPIGVQVIAKPNNDRLCLAVAREFEKAFGGWEPPSTV
ncbi:unnamed protein product [Brassicogethes aeneus]|uniref:Amidase domain-containing protein n=1 Tax=Brassicogethes aeneus TaxID=1431903 RepID=A0A9P0BF21_BRAAE|nr:unnamed protein product [Brassicogethes aeneus]